MHYFVKKIPLLLPFLPPLYIYTKKLTYPPSSIHAPIITHPLRILRQLHKPLQLIRGIPRRFITPLIQFTIHIEALQNPITRHHIHIREDLPDHPTQQKDQNNREPNRAYSIKITRTPHYQPNLKRGADTRQQNPYIHKPIPDPSLQTKVHHMMQHHQKRLPSRRTETLSSQRHLNKPLLVLKLNQPFKASQTTMNILEQLINATILCSLILHIPF